MPIVGVDLGYTYTKTSEMLKFESKISEVEPLLGGKRLKIDGCTYFMGEGKGTVDLNKIDSVITKACLFYALGKVKTGAEGFKIVTGLPIAQYQTLQEGLKQMILNNRYKMISVDLEPDKRIYIEDVKVYPQGAGALYGQNIVGDAIVVDIGGRTVDIAYFSIQDGVRKLTKSETLFDGMLTLYSSIINRVNAKYMINLQPEYSQNILINGLTIDGDKQDIGFLKPVISEHIEGICNEIRLNYPANTTTIYLCGGGAELLEGAFKRHFKDIQKLNNSQFANAIGYKKVGEAIWTINR
ncbi:MAG: ParM/StbA family protein [Angelakisella sp.]